MGAKKKEMERLVKIFTEFIKQHENFELLYSKKLDCYLLLELNFYMKDVEDTGCYYEPKEFCRKMFEIIAQDAFALSEYEHDEPDEQEQAEMKRLLGVYAKQLPEYKYLADEVLEGYGVWGMVYGVG